MKNIVIIGVSTGGPMTLRRLFGSLPPLDAAFVIVLHIAAGMDRRIAKGLDAVSSMPVSLAEDGEYLEPGQVYLAPGGCHLTVKANNRIVLRDGPRVNYVQPSADVAMTSLLKPLRGSRIVGIILTGMGKDGAAGIRHIKTIGGVTIAQDRESSAIYGMPKAAVETGMVDFQFGTPEIARKLIHWFSVAEP